MNLQLPSCKGRCIRRATYPLVAVFWAFLLAGAAQASGIGFTGGYSFGDFTFGEGGGIFPNGSASSPDSNTVVLTGSDDGSGLPGTTDLTIAALGDGLFQFSYEYTTLDLFGDPATDPAGYLVDGTFFPFVDPNLFSGTVSVPVLAGDVIGFRVATTDNLFGPGVLTITDFDAPLAPTPEPASLPLLLIGAAAIGICGKSRRIRSLFTATLGIVATCVFVTSEGTPAWAQSPVFYSGTNITGQLAMIGVVNALQPVQLAGAQQLGASALKGAQEPDLLELRAGRAQALGAGVSGEILKPPPPRLHPPVDSPTSTPKAPRSSLLPPSIRTLSSSAHALSLGSSSTFSGFNAISHLDMRLAYGGNQFSIEPPNQSIAVGNGYVLEGVNDAIQVYTTSGSPVLPVVIASNQLFGLAPAIDRTTGANGVYLTDMRVSYDQNINRWIVVQRSLDNDVFGNLLNSSHLYIAVSQTGDPTGNYNIYRMDTTNAGHSSCPCVDDYPQIGSDQYGFHIAWNEFTANSFPQFVDAAILTLSKADLASGAASPIAFQFLIAPTTGFEFAIQPSTTPPGAANYLANGGVEYFVSSYFRGAGNQVALWAMSNTSSLATPSPNLTLTRIVVPTLNYTFPDVATQPAGATPYGSSLGEPLEVLDGGDTRVQALSYASAKLFLTLPTGLFDDNGHFVVGGAYIVIAPGFRNGALAAAVVNQGYLMVDNNHLLRPAISVNAKGVGAIAVTLSGPDWYPSALNVPVAVGVPEIVFPLSVRPFGRAPAETDQV